MSEPVLTPPELKAPPGACDTHMHFYGPDSEYPWAHTAPFTVPDATPALYRRQIQQRLGLERVVIVQPASYGMDNRRTLDALVELGDAARAIVVEDTSVTDEELERLTGLGARGLRFHMWRGGILPWDILEEMAARVRPFGWHVQLQLDGRDLPQHEAMLNRLPVGLVIDHVGRFAKPVPPDHEAFRCLLRLVERGAWVKLSGPYITSRERPPAYEDVGRLARELVRAAPERMLWASNWPHPGLAQGQTRPDDAVLLDTLLHWIDDDATRRRILVDNPAELYGFQ